MALVTFGITPDSVRGHHFPHIDAFSTSSAPTLAIVTEAINEEAGRMQGALLKESIQASAITAATGPYVSCARALRLAVAVRIAADMTGANPELVKAWKAQLKDWFDGLAADGATFLGDDTLSAAASDPDGPTTHIDEYSLDTGNAADASTATPYLRRDDEL